MTLLDNQRPSVFRMALLVAGWSADRNLAPRYMPMWTNEAKAEDMEANPILGCSLHKSEVSL